MKLYAYMLNYLNGYQGRSGFITRENVPCGDICTKDYSASFMFCGTFKVKCPLTLDIIVQLFEMFIRQLFLYSLFVFLSFYNFVLM